MVKGDEYTFDPGRIVVTGAGPLRIRLDNTGNLAHNLVLFDGDAGWRARAPSRAASSRALSVRGPPGAYRMVCTVGDHEELGMRGELELP